MKLALFFTAGVSLKVWDEAGILDREIKPYRKLSEYFDEIYFFTYGSAEELEYSKALPENIRIFPNRWGFSPKVYSLLLPLLYRRQFRQVSVLKTNQIYGSWSAWLAKLLFRKKLVVRCGYLWSIFAEKAEKSGWKRRLARLLERKVTRAADAVIVASQNDKEQLARNYRVNSEKIHLIPNYIDTELFSPKETGKESGTICFVGRFSRQKNLFELFKALAGTDFKLRMVGDGELKEELKELAVKLKIKAEFIGSITNEKLPEVLVKNELFILPSLYEGCPKTLLEAMSCGLPCIGAGVAGIREIIVDKENGLLCGTDALSIRKAIEEAGSSPALRKKISRNARKTILERFSLEKNIELERRIYENL